MIAAPAGEQGEALALGAGDHHQGAIQIRFLQAHAALGIQTHHPVTLLPQGLQGTVEIDHPGHGQVFQGPGGHLGHGTRQAGIAPLWEHQSVNAEGFGAPEDGAEVLGIREAIDGDEQGGFPQLPAAIDQAR